MTTRTTILLLCIALAAFMLLACQWDGDQDARNQWQSEIQSRQRGLDPTPTTEVAER